MLAGNWLICLAWLLVVPWGAEAWVPPLALYFVSTGIMGFANVVTLTSAETVMSKKATQYAVGGRAGGGVVWAGGWVGGQVGGCVGGWVGGWVGRRAGGWVSMRGAGSLLGSVEGSRFGGSCLLRAGPAVRGGWVGGWMDGQAGGWRLMGGAGGLLGFVRVCWGFLCRG